MFRQHSGPVVRCHAGLTFAIGLTVTLIGHVGAQTNFDACYADKTGVIYLIDPSGKNPANLPLECAKTGKHIQFTWVDAKGAQHAGLTGLRDDDHPQYLLTTGARPMTGDLIVRNKLGIGVTTASAPLTLLPVDGADIEFASGTGDNADIYARNTFNIGTLSNHPVSLLTQGQFRLFVAGDGKVGVGTHQPTEQLTVAGTVESTTGGFKFPDGTVQTSAAAGGAPAILADGVTSTTDGFAVTGTFGTGSIPTSGPGTRLLWYAGKAAFRAGAADGVQWDDAQIGGFSAAFGFASAASGGGSLAAGERTTASGTRSTALGHLSNAGGDASLAVGVQTTASGDQATALGYLTTASGRASTALGFEATAIAEGATALGFQTNAADVHATAMGAQTAATGAISTATGYRTVASGARSTAMGDESSATAFRSMAFGYLSTASGDHSIAIGTRASASTDGAMAFGNLAIASGANATAIGENVEASGIGSTVMGSNASTNGMAGSFVIGDRSIFDPTLLATAPNQFIVRSSGGTIIHTAGDLSAGVELLPGAGAWSTVSDRNRKHLFRDISGESVLADIAAMPIQSWSYRSQDASIRHVGPTAQDFFAAFGLGSSDLTITTSDISGINMLAIQALERRTRELAEARAKLDELESRLAALEAALTGQTTTPVNR